MRKKILIIGGDSRLGKELKTLCKKKNISIIATSRRIEKNYLDLNNIHKFKIPKNISAAVILGGVTSYSDCEKFKKKSNTINTINIPELAFKILQKKIFLCYVSSNTVLNYRKPPSEYQKPNPKFEYSIQKAKAENKLLNFVRINKFDEYFSILRLTKNISENTKPFKEWIKNIQNNESIKAYDDLFFSPILFTNSSNVLLKILKNKKKGIFHLSNKLSLNYYNFANKLIKFLGLKISVIRKSSNDDGVNLNYKHNVSSLNMNSTIKRLKINYVDLHHIFQFFKIKINEKKN